jgi:hypothetical protein
MRVKPTTIWGMPVSMLLGAAALLFIIAIAGCDQSGPQTPEQLQVEACHADWRKCRDNKEIVYTWAGGPGGITPRVTCEFAANDLAKYGTPEWPGCPAYSFNNFFSSTSESALATGHLILIETEARFQNAFGAMAHVRVTCDYNLNNKTATVHIEQR